jgi:hypothetical protein
MQVRAADDRCRGEMNRSMLGRLKGTRTLFLDTCHEHICFGG